MVKRSTNISDKKVNTKVKEKNHTHMNNDNYLLRMSHAPALDEPSGWFQMIPVILFTAVIVIITRMATYERPMSQFFWTSDSNQLVDFFSYYKMGAIVFCAVLALVLLLFRVFIQSLTIKKNYAYIPMIVYAVFVLISYVFSNYKEFALWGWNDRFEGTVTLLCYMVMLFFVINTVNSEKNVKLIIHALAGISVLLSLLGLSQALDHDFFQTAIGKKLITPSWYWDQVDKLNFTFQNREIYQTVYNINYVSFYLTLLIPLFGMLFIRSVMAKKEEPVRKKLLWGVLFALTVYNLIGSASSGGLMGMAVAAIIAIIVLNKRLVRWIVPIIILLLIVIAVAGISYSRWMPELTNAVKGVLGTNTEQAVPGYGDSAPGANDPDTEESESDSVIKHKLDYFETAGNDIILGYQGDTITFTTYPEDPTSLTIVDSSGNKISAVESTVDAAFFSIDDPRYDWISLRPVMDDNSNNYLIIKTDDFEWPFVIKAAGVQYRTGVGSFVPLHQVPAKGWEDNQNFGSGRGYIWSRTIPMLSRAMLIGHGADTYCIYFPHNDYVGKYNADWNINMVVDKPHNMYMGIIIGTGGISMLALLALWGIYIVQSFLLYTREKYNDFMAYAGVGIFLGICGFLISALVNDSSVSVTPMFYGLLGTGIAINMMLKNRKYSLDREK